MEVSRGDRRATHHLDKGRLDANQIGFAVPALNPGAEVGCTGTSAQSNMAKPT